jgi:pyrimidine operon attenuation protein/uracil phosphoribosyltransferase
MGMQKRLILNSSLLEITIDRLCQQLIENHENFDQTVLVGLQPRGVFLAEMIHQRILHACNISLPLGYLDTTFYRDDFRRRELPKEANETKMDFIIESKRVVLIDDVLYTGRSVRAAMDAMLAYGRPEKVELLVLVNRKYSRDLPIEPDYVGRNVNTIDTQKVNVEWAKYGAKQNSVYLTNV